MLAKSLAFCIAVCFGISETHAQTASSEPLDIKIQMTPCAPISPPRALITSLETGLAKRVFSLNQDWDKVPPCGGPNPTAAPVQAFPTELIIPQLVKIKSNAGQCSGALIARNAVITAGHCVYSQGSFFRNIVVFPGYQNGPNSEFEPHVGLEVLTFTGYTADKQNAHDIAVIKLGGAVVHPKYNPYGVMAFTSDCNALSKEYFRPHYNPAFKNLEVQADAQGLIQSCRDGMVVTGLPTGGGSSGSGVVDRYARAVFAVHSVGDGSFSYEAPLTKAKIYAINNLLDETAPPQNCFAGN